MTEPLVFACNVCRKEVDEATHVSHMKILDAIWSAEVPGYDDLFVHVRGPVDEFDQNGFVVVCNDDFIEELANNLTGTGEVFLLN